MLRVAWLASAANNIFFDLMSLPIAGTQNSKFRDGLRSLSDAQELINNILWSQSPYNPAFMGKVINVVNE